MQSDSVSPQTLMMRNANNCTARWQAVLCKLHESTAANVLTLIVGLIHVLLLDCVPEVAVRVRALNNGILVDVAVVLLLSLHNPAKSESACLMDEPHERSMCSTTAVLAVTVLCIANPLLVVAATSAWPASHAVLCRRHIHTHLNPQQADTHISCSSSLRMLRI